MIKLKLLNGRPPPACDRKSSVLPLGLTSKNPSANGSLLVNPFRYTWILLMAPVVPLTTISEAYGLAGVPVEAPFEPACGIVIGPALQKPTVPTGGLLCAA